MKTITTI